MDIETIDNERLPLIRHNDEDVVDNWGPTEEETSFTTHDPFETPTAPSSASLMSQEITRQKIRMVFNKLGVEGDVGVNIDRFRTRENTKTGVVILEFDKTGRGEWVNLTNKRTGEPLNASTIKNVFGGISAMKNFLGFEETPAGLNRSVTEAARVRDQIEQIDMQSMSNEQVIDAVETIRKETADISTNTDLDMREMLGLDKALQRISGELKKNLAKLSELDNHIRKENRKLKQVENDPFTTDEQRQEIRDRRERLNEERDARLELVSQNRKDLSSQFSRMRETIEKLLDGDLSLGEKIKLLFREQGVTIAAVLTALGLIIESIVQAFTGGTSGGGGSTPPKDEKGIKKWFQDKLKALARLFGKLAGKAAAALPEIIGSVVSAILNFLKKTVSFLAEHTWATIVGIVSFIGYLLYQNLVVKRRR